VGGVVVGELGGVVIEALAQHFGIACRAEARGHPAEFGAHAPRPLVLEQGLENLEAAAQATCAHSHLVHGVGQVPAQEQVGEQEPTTVHCEVGADDLSGRCRGRRPGQLRHIGGHRCPLAQRGTGLAHGAGHRTCGEEGFSDPAEEALVQGAPRMRDRLGLDLTEALGDVISLEDRHGVIHYFHEGNAVGVDEEARGALGLKRCHRSQGRGAREGRDQASEFGGDIGSERSVHLIADAVTLALHGQFEVPAFIRAACAATQGDAPAEEPEVGSVVVDVAHREGRA